METVSFNSILSDLSLKAYQNDIPLNGAFELTPLCNLNCKMCYVHLNDSSVKERMLSGQAWIALMKEAIGRGMMNALLTGGEALTHPDFWKIYMFLINNGVIPRLKTNGLLMNEETIGRFSQYPPYMIDISLYGCDGESYLAVTGVDAFDRVVANIRSVVSAGLPLRIAVTPSRYMARWTKDIIALAKSFGVPVLTSAILIDPDEDTGRKRADFDLPVVDCLGESYKSERKNNGERRPDIPEKGLRCNSGRNLFAIHWDGTMVPCLGFPKSISSGNPLKDGFTTNWERINGEVKNLEVPKQCHTCRINTKCHYCPVQHNRLSSRLVCNPKVCDKWKSFYGA